jgi:hypothetical protein
VLQDSRNFGHAPAISRAISHKNRVFGQSHWMNGFSMYHDVITMMEPQFRGGKLDLANTMFSKCSGSIENAIIAYVTDSIACR